MGASSANVASPALPPCASWTFNCLVHPKPTAYGRATLGAKPFRRAPFRKTARSEHGLSSEVETVGQCSVTKYRASAGETGQVGRVEFAL
jgi:hypothetical protein